jgi:2-oxoglutarate dehydrogenase E2 component (dihydrolipoamide succinyltransferase)
MARIEIHVPALGETVSEGVVSRWCRQPGEYVARGDVLAELSTDKVDVEVAAHADGWLSAIHAPAGATVAVNELIAEIDTTPGLTPAPMATPRPPEIRCLRCAVPMEPANTLPLVSRVRLLVCRTCGRVEMVAEDPGTF